MSTASPLRPASPSGLLGLVLVMTGLLSSPVLAEQPVEELLRNVEVRLSNGRATVPVLVVRTHTSRPQPYALLLHGRGTNRVENARIGRADYPANARWLARLGYTVIIPTRIGYGIAQGPDLEDTGPCEDKHYETALDAARAEVSAVLEDARAAHLASRDGIVIGESFGGLIAVALASKPPEGLKAAINIAGGDGGDSLHHVDAPCQPERLTRQYALLGQRNQHPVLWMYSRNDRYWGPELPHRWFEAFRASGGRGEFVDLPADKNNGHFIFNRNAPAWQPTFLRFTAALGLPRG
jgi:dienelactone hydrolase